MEKRTTETQAITPEQRQTYREKLLASLQVARRYDGTEQSFNQLIDTVNTLDHWMRDTFGSGAAIPIQKEMELARTSGTKRDHSINSILDIADAQLRQCLEGPKSLDDMLRELKIAFTEIDQVLLPTNPKSPPPGGGEWEEAVIEPRLQRLILTLQKHHIFIDDILVTKGAVDPAQMRKQPYVLVEIPRIGREVLVCNQVGEATFVSRRHLALQTYLTLPKEALEQVEGVERIVSRGTGKWEVDVMEALLKELPEGEMKKIDVRDVESLRREILKKIPTGVEWVAMTRPIRKKFSIAGRGEVAIATAFGVDHGHDPRGSQYAHAQLGTRIFGEDDPAIHAVLRVENEWQGFEINPVKLKNEIRRRIPTAQEWIAMQSNQKKVFRIGGRGELAIAKTLGVSLEQDPCGYPYPHALLGSAIYGEEDPAIQATLKEEREWQELEKDTAKLKAEIRRKIPTAQEWMKMNRHEKY
ncbi:MAG: hypothetical protein Q7S29_02955 [Candidatus Peribacter sp.]|nr:hypothetical protein [Candidatus Peribacter sp.]